MIKAKEYYSDVFVEEDDLEMIQCNWCEEQFKSGDLLLDVSYEDKNGNVDITEYCPKCKKSGYLMDLQI